MQKLNAFYFLFFPKWNDNEFSNHASMQLRESRSRSGLFRTSTKEEALDFADKNVLVYDIFGSISIWYSLPFFSL